MENKYYKQAPQMRENIVDKEVKPWITRVFNNVPECKSIIMLIGCWWNDNASDEIQDKFYLSKKKDLTVFEFEFDMKLGKTQESWDEDGKLETSKYVESWSYDKEIGDYFRFKSDRTSIPAFQSFCKEYGSQEYENVLESYTPYAIFTQDENTKEVLVNIVGEMWRPELEGMPSEYESNYGEDW